MDSFYDTTAFHRDHLGEKALGALGCTPAQVAFSTFRSYEDTCRSQAKTLGCGLVGLDLVLPFGLLARHLNTPYSQNSAA